MHDGLNKRRPEVQQDILISLITEYNSVYNEIRAAQYTIKKNYLGNPRKNS